MRKTPPEQRYALMDARAFTGDTENAAIFTTGTANQMIREANSGDFGAECAIVDLQSDKVMWEWFENNHWRKP